MAEKTAAETVLNTVKRMLGGVGVEENTATALAGKNLPLGVDNRANPELQYNMLSHTTPAAETVARGIADTGILDREKRQRMITGALDAITPGESPLPAPSTKPIVGTGKDIPGKVTAEKGREVALETPSPSAAAADTRHPMEKKYGGDIYAALAAMPDEKFRNFVDKHKDAVPGIGYIQDSGPDGKGTGKITRIIENPAVAAAQAKAKPYEEMTLAEKKLQNEAVAAQGVVENARATRAYHEGVGRQANELKKETNATAKEQNFLNELKAFGKKNLETGEIDADDYLLKTAVHSPDAIPDGRYKARATALKNKFDAWATARLSDPKNIKLGWKDTPEMRLTLLDKYLNPPPVK